MDTEAAWVEGTNVRTALKLQPEATREALICLVADVCRFVDAKRTLTTASDFIFCVESLVDAMPAMKLEEWALVCSRMKQGYYGNYYERLKVSEFREAMMKHEEERLPHLEKMHTSHQVTRGTDDPSRVTFEPQSMLDLWKKRNAWMYTGNNLEARANGQVEEDAGQDL